MILAAPNPVSGLYAFSSLFILWQIGNTQLPITLLTFNFYNFHIIRYKNEVLFNDMYS